MFVLNVMQHPVRDCIGVSLALRDAGDTHIIDVIEYSLN